MAQPARHRVFAERRSRGGDTDRLPEEAATAGLSEPSSGCSSVSASFPAIAAASSTVTGMERTTQREFCGSCHVMTAHYEDAADPASQSLAARHSRNPFFGEQELLRLPRRLRHVRLRDDQGGRHAPRLRVLPRRLPEHAARGVQEGRPPAKAVRQHQLPPVPHDHRCTTGAACPITSRSRRSSSPTR